MIFNTWSFGIFAVVALVLYWAVIPQRAKPYYIIIAGCVFYAFSVPVYLALIVTLGAITYAVARIMLSTTAETTKKLLMCLGALLIAGTLAYFKYSRFFAQTVNDVARHDILPVPSILVPLAISFFTFEFIHVLVDVYLRKIDRVDLLDFATFTMFFPTLVAGPIKRYQTFAPQIRSITLPDEATLTLNLYRIVMGLAKKFIIADSMNAFTQPLLTPAGAPYGRLDYIVAVAAYAAKIYFDFTGYSDIAIGVGGLMGIRLPENFDRPYWSENISVFWRRWHMSLSTWIRDYIFIPLGGSRRHPIVTSVNLFLAMAIAGLWHGAAWTFVLWGLWHGLGLAIHRVWSSKVAARVAFLRTPSQTVYLASVGLTFAFVVAGWILFAASSLGAAVTVFSKAIL